MSSSDDRHAWWRDAVIYQVYPRSFADANGDGVGDLAGIRSHLSYIRDLGVDAIWLNPWYPSPMADAGYDIADFRDIDPVFGTLAEAEALLADAHVLGLRVLLDMVPNHTSSAHPWFQAAVAAGPASLERRRYLFRAGRGDGALPPNDWVSVFGGSAWTRVTEADGRAGEWYLHLFDTEQPDLNWAEPEVREEFLSILRFWFDRGVDGFRIDVANALMKDEELPDLGERSEHAVLHVGPEEHPFWDRETVLDVYRDWRRLADSYPDPRVFVAEAWVPTADRLARYVRPDRLHSAFNFDFLVTPWRAALLRASIDEALTALAAVGAEPTWVLSNHDVVRVVTRLGLPQSKRRGWAATTDDSELGEPDLELGMRRARAAMLLTLALPGGAYVYQGEELGLWEVRDLPDDALRDPIWERSGHARRGRDGARIPLPWTADGVSFGFGPAGGAPPWLPQPSAFGRVSIERQTGVPDSMLELYRRALRIRHEHPGLGSGPLRWREAPRGVLAFEREHGLVVVVNVEGAPVDLPKHRRVLLASGPLDGSRLPPDGAVWLEV
jgi:alpha-glucosidase